MAIEILRATSRDHFEAAAKLHAEGISEGFLSSLGPAFLAALYRGICQGQNSGVFVAREEDKILGFVSFAEDVKACYRTTLRKQWPRLSLAMLPNLFKPGVYRKIFETLRYPAAHESDTLQGPDSSPAPKRSELLSMAVSPLARGKGTGKLLVKALDDEMLRLGVRKYVLITHAVDPRSNGFYVSCGFKLSREFTNHRKPMNEYQKELPPPPLP